MKNQYFGDINDYRKYGLLRAIIRAIQLRLLVVWMLTPDDGSNDGRFLRYLEDRPRWSGHDPVLFRTLSELVTHGGERRVSSLEATDLLPQAAYFSSPVPDSASGRSAWFSALSERAQGADLVFLDPDNGMEVKSEPYGRRGSSKYVYWREVEALWSSGASLLIYQHVVREKRVAFVQRMLAALGRATPGSHVEAFTTPHVVFLLALQPEGHHAQGAIVRSVQESWKGQIQRWEPADV
jgi:hypothetical protein